MSKSFPIYEDVLFEYVKKVKRFNELITNKYQLIDLPYNVSGRLFPKIGEIEDENGIIISYRFHGRGATFYEGLTKIHFDVDTNSKYQIIVSIGGFYCFLKTYVKDYDENFPVEQLMEEFELRGMFIKRKISDLGGFHVNEIWYESKLKNNEFTGYNRFDIDWN
jgi:hypothetical protein